MTIISLASILSSAVRAAGRGRPPRCDRPRTRISPSRMCRWRRPSRRSSHIVIRVLAIGSGLPSSRREKLPARMMRAADSTSSSRFRAARPPGRRSLPSCLRITPPIITVSTFPACACSTALNSGSCTGKRFRSFARRITMSAFLPTVIEPILPSSPSARALPMVAHSSASRDRTGIFAKAGFPAAAFSRIEVNARAVARLASRDRHLAGDDRSRRRCRATACRRLTHAQRDRLGRVTMHSASTVPVNEAPASTQALSSSSSMYCAWTMLWSGPSRPDFRQPEVAARVAIGRRLVACEVESRPSSRASRWSCSTTS